MEISTRRKNAKKGKDVEDEAAVVGEAEVQLEDIERKRIQEQVKVDDDDDDDDDVDDSESDEDEEIEDDDDVDDDEDVEDDDEGDSKQLGKKRKAESELKAPKGKKAKKEKAAPKGKKAPKEKKPPKEKKVKAPKVKKEKPVKVVKPILDQDYNFEESYFYQELPASQWEEIKQFLTNYFTNSKNDQAELKNFFDHYPKIKKGDQNTKMLQNILEATFASFTGLISLKLFESYKSVNTFFLNEYYRAKPSVHECYFFPSEVNEAKVANMLRTCKKTLDIAIFALTNNVIFAAIEEAFKRGVSIRLIADDECCKFLGSDVIRVAALGVPVKTDSDVKAHMHHKFAILDNSVVITGSFNWTAQAVKLNQENIFFYESRELAIQYTAEFNALWNQFTEVVTQEQGLKVANAEIEKKRIAAEKKQAEKEKKLAEKEKAKKEKEAAKKAK